MIFKKLRRLSFAAMGLTADGHDGPETGNDYLDPLESSVIAGAGRGGDGASEFALDEAHQVAKN